MSPKQKLVQIRTELENRIKEIEQDLISLKNRKDEVTMLLNQINETIEK